MKRTLYILIAALISFHINAQALYFPPTSGDNWATLSPSSLGYCEERIDSLYAFLDDNNTKAFILLKDGKIVLEKYYDSHTQYTPWYWASAGKTLTSFMVGIAQQEGYLSIDDPTSDYLREGWTSCTPEQEENITIWHQLTMTTGLDDGVSDYTCTLDTCLIFKAPAGTRWAYHNAPYTLLTSVIENATGKLLNSYIKSQLLDPTGMNGKYYKLNYNHVFFSTARSMARFGLLMLNEGNWDGNQIMTDTTYFHQMVNTSQQLNKSYGYLWWLNGELSFMVPRSQIVFPGPLFPDAPQDMYAAMGKNGQFIDVVPSRNLVLIRIGKAPDEFPVPFLLNNAIWEYVNKLKCNPTSVDYQILGNTRVQVFPNPVDDVLNIQSNRRISQVKIFNIQGRLEKSEKFANLTSVHFSIQDLSAGLYFIQLRLGDNSTITKKLLIK